jgi:hypothetical protein
MNTEKIARYVWMGRKDIMWYQTAQDLFTDLFGPEKLLLVSRLFAATSINTSLKANITLFRRALYEIEKNKPPGRYLPNIRQQLEQIRAGNKLTGRKINSFANAMAGDPDAVVVDVWLLRAFEMDRKSFRKDKADKSRGRYRSSGATDREYTIIENHVRQEAKAMGLQARQLSAMIWSGVRIDQSGDKETHYDRILRYHFNNLYNVI